MLLRAASMFAFAIGTREPRCSAISLPLSLSEVLFNIMPGSARGEAGRQRPAELDEAVPCQRSPRGGVSRRGRRPERDECVRIRSARRRPKSGGLPKTRRAG
eukprot:10270833-Alexandrium_andersonii.AAC.1